MKKTGVRQMIFGILGSLACGVSVMGCYPLVPAYFTALYLEQVNGVVLLAFMYIGMTLFMPLTAAVKYGVTLIVMIGAVKLIEWANEGCPAFLAGVMAGLTTLILSFCGSLLEWKNQPDGAAVFLEAVFIFGAVILLNRLLRSGYTAWFHNVYCLLCTFFHLLKCFINPIRRSSIMQAC